MNKEYVVEEILSGRVRRGGKVEYQVKWLGYEEITWERAPNLANCKELLKEYEQKRKKEKAKEDKRMSKSRKKRMRNSERSSSPTPIKNVGMSKESKSPKGPSRGEEDQVRKSQEERKAQITAAPKATPSTSQKRPSPILTNAAKKHKPSVEAKAISLNENVTLSIEKVNLGGKSMKLMEMSESERGSSCGSIEANKGYQVEEVISAKIGNNGGLEYHIKWRGYGPEDNTWVSREDMLSEHPKDLIEFENAKGRKRRSASLKRNPSEPKSLKGTVVPEFRSRRNTFPKMRTRVTKRPTLNSDADQTREHPPSLEGDKKIKVKTSLKLQTPIKNVGQTKRSTSPNKRPSIDQEHQGRKSQEGRKDVAEEYETNLKSPKKAKKGNRSRVSKSPNGNSAYEVEKILDRRVLEDGNVEYFIKWKGCGDEVSSWEPHENWNCNKLVEAFEKDRNRDGDYTNTKSMLSAKPGTSSKDHSKRKLEGLDNDKGSKRVKRSSCVDRRTTLNSDANQTREREKEEREGASPKPPLRGEEDQVRISQEECKAQITAAPKATPSTGQERGTSLRSGTSKRSPEKSAVIEVVRTPQDEEKGEENKTKTTRTWTPQEDGQEGFDKGFEPDKILWATTTPTEEILFLMKWKDAESSDLVRASVANVRCPQVVIAFYEQRVHFLRRV